MVKNREYLPEEAVVFDNPAFDNSIVGITSDGGVVYDYDSMVEELALDDNISYEEAADFISYNTMRVIPYVRGEGVTPVIMFSIID